MDETSQGMFSDAVYNQRIQVLLIWKLLVPLSLLLVVFLTYALMLGDKHPFQRTFGHGDLLIFSVLILIEAAIELKSINSRYYKLLAVCAVLSIFFFGIIKYVIVVHKQGLSDTAGSQPSELLLAFSYFNFAAILCSIIGGFYASLIAAREISDRKLKELA